MYFKDQIMNERFYIFQYISPIYEYMVNLEYLETLLGYSAIFGTFKNTQFWLFLAPPADPVEIRENPENGPFLRPKKCFWVVFFCFPARNLYWQVRFAKKRTRFGQSGPLEHRL